MKRALVFVAVAISVVMVYGEPADKPTSNKIDKKLVHAFLAKDKEPTSKFRSDSPKISAFWKGEALKAGDRVRAIWIAEDVGSASLKNAKITEASVTAYKPDDDGVFSVVRPKGGWPAGRYRLEIYVGDKLAETLKFAIEADVSVEIR